MSNIEWTDETWNVFVGCSKVSAGCSNCYAINQAYRNNAMAQKMPNQGRMKYYEGLTEKKGEHVEWTGLVNFVPEALEIPFKWKKPRKVFVNSMSDLFHDAVTDEQLDQVFAVMALTAQHTYQVLTKRPKRMKEYLTNSQTSAWFSAIDVVRATGAEYPAFEHEWEWPLPNVWLGVSVENQQASDDRIPYLLETPAAVRFLSCEPLLGSIDLSLLHMEGITNIDCLNGRHGVDFPLKGKCNKIDWVIVGGESGAGARSFDLTWARWIQKQCKDAGVSFFLKQLGSNVFGSKNFVQEKIKLKSRKGGDMTEWPEELRVRQFPKK